MQNFLNWNEIVSTVIISNKTKTETKEIIDYSLIFYVYIFKYITYN